MTRYRIAALAVLLGAVLLATPVRADDLIVIPKAQRLIDDCWEMTLEERRSDTARALMGIYASQDCLKDAIIDQIPFFFPHGRPLNKATTRRQLDRLGAVVGDLLWPMYNENPGCVKYLSRCGNINNYAHNGTVSRFLEHILKEMIDVRESDGSW